MNNFFKSVFSENNDVSCMRVMCMISLFVGASLAYISLFKNCTLDTSSTTIGIFIASAFGGKVWHKFAETSNVKKEKP